MGALVEHPGAQRHQLAVRLLHGFLQRAADCFRYLTHGGGGLQTADRPGQGQRKRGAAGVGGRYHAPVYRAARHLCGHVTGSGLAGAILNSSDVKLHSCVSG